MALCDDRLSWEHFCQRGTKIFPILDPYPERPLGMKTNKTKWVPTCPNLALESPRDPRQKHPMSLSNKSTRLKDANQERHSCSKFVFQELVGSNLWHLLWNFQILADNQTSDIYLLCVDACKSEVIEWIRVSCSTVRFNKEERGSDDAIPMGKFTPSQGKMRESCTCQSQTKRLTSSTSRGSRATKLRITYFIRTYIDPTRHSKIAESLDCWPWMGHNVATFGRGRTAPVPKSLEWY